MRRQIYIICVLLLLTLITLPHKVHAEDIGLGSLRIEPNLPIMLKSPAEFNISATNRRTVYDPHILLVMTDASYKGLKGSVTVEWNGGSISFSKADFTEVSGTVPPSGAHEGVYYRVECLKSQIGYEGPLWYAYGPFLSRPVDNTKQEFTVTLPSTSPRMLVYAIGKSNPNSNVFDVRVPPSIPGFVIPDLAPMLLATASFSAFGLYGIKRRKAK